MQSGFLVPLGAQCGMLPRTAGGAATLIPLLLPTLGMQYLDQINQRMHETESDGLFLLHSLRLCV